MTSNRQRAATITGQGQKPAYQAPVFSRLQGLFPNAPSPSTLAPRSRQKSATVPNVKPQVPEPRAIKVRVITWNMHDSLPKGDLEDLLGKVPYWSQANSSPGKFPNLGTGAEHPYHLIIVAGQECPSISGIPMGLGAGFKSIIDKEREREKLHDKPWSKHKEKDKDESERARKNGEEHEIPSGWTSMLEDWLCQGNGSATRTGSPAVADISLPKPLSPRLPSKESRKGPYQLLSKERMMGIYLAVFIHRDMRPLVRGTSRSAVTTGLIGGRVGNKGGVGITIDLDGTTFLFLNAHLAAHEGKIKDRLSNLAKIKTELTVDDFLSPDDSRVMEEDLTNKFDYTFFCGDLNFRLEMTRLHADWLLSRKDYAQALAFDQLKRLMQNCEAFAGFSEALINFPPTFKYDVQRSHRHSKRRRSRLDRKKHLEERSNRLTEIEEKELEELKKEEEEGEGEGDGDGEEGASVASSAWTVAHSKADTDRDLDEDVDELFTSPSSQTIATNSSKVSIAQKAVKKAKMKWLSLIIPSPVSLSDKSIKAKRDPLFRKTRAPHASVDVSLNSSPTLPAAPPFDMADQRHLRPSPSPLVNSIRSNLSNDGEDSDEKGVYDSSHKKRVPSWCDRILWKSTVELEEEELPPQLRPRNRMGQFFANFPFRPISIRMQRDSIASISSDLHEETQTHFPETNVPRNIAILPPNHHDRRGSTGDAGPSKLVSLASEHSPARRATGSSSIPTDTPTASYSPTPTTTWWPRFFPSFLSTNSTQTSTSADMPSGPGVVPPHKGDVVCLGYSTLDDREMRKLEGRSDHRPVIGKYVVYL